MKTIKDRILEFQDVLNKWTDPYTGLTEKGKREIRKWLKKQFNQIALAARVEGEALAKKSLYDILDIEKIPPIVDNQPYRSPPPHEETIKAFESDCCKSDYVGDSLKFWCVSCKEVCGLSYKASEEKGEIEEMEYNGRKCRAHPKYGLQYQKGRDWIAIPLAWMKNEDEIQRFQKRVEELERKFVVLWNERIDEIKKNVTPNL